MTAVRPRFDGIYASIGVSKDHGQTPGDPIGTFFRRFGREAHARAYARFFEDGLLIYDDAIVNYDPEPARPTLGREWGGAGRQFRWTTVDGQLQITAPSGAVSYATVEPERLVWDSGPPYTGGAYTFLQALE
jgi:hypothetical protein